MSERDLSALDQFRDGEIASSPNVVLEKDEPRGPAPIALDRKILAFDQSLANTGFALIIGARVVHTGNLKNKTQLNGPEPQLDRAVEMYNEVSQTIYDTQPDLIVYETPPSGSRLTRPESSLMAATVIRIAAAKLLVPTMMVGAQKGKKRWTGNGNAKKPVVREALLAIDPNLKMKKPMNEAVYDAISIGWYASEVRT